MNSLIEITNIVLPVFLVIGLGYVLGAVGFLGPEASSRLSKLVFYVAGPVLLFRSAALTPLSRAIDLRAMGSIAGVTVLTAFAVYLVCFRSSPSRRGVLAQGAQRSNMFLIGLPLIENAFGATVLGPAAVLIGFMVPVYNLLAVLLLSLPHHAENPGERGLWKKAALDVLRNPLIIGSMGGVVFSVKGISQPKDKGIMLKNILEDGANKCGRIIGRYLVNGKRQDHKMSVAGLTTQRLEIRNDNKTNTLSTIQKDNVIINIEKFSPKYTKNYIQYDIHNKGYGSQDQRAYFSTGKHGTLDTYCKSKAKLYLNNNLVRKLTVLECERLQTFPDNYTEGVSNTQRYKMLGNSFTVDVIKHILSFMPK